MPSAATAGATANSDALVGVTTKVTSWPLSSEAPSEMAVAHPDTVCRPESSVTVSSAPAVNDGASLTLSMVIVNVWVPLVSAPPPLSLSVTSTSVLPFALAAGVKVSVPDALMAGPATNSDGSSATTENVGRTSEPSLVAPLLMSVAQS